MLALLLAVAGDALAAGPRGNEARVTASNVAAAHDDSPPAGPVAALDHGSPGRAPDLEPSPIAPISPATDYLLVSATEGTTLTELAAAISATGIQSEPTALPDTLRVGVPADGDTLALASRLATVAGVAAIEPDGVIRAGRVASDPLYARQAPYLEAIRAPEAWDITTGTPDVVVAVIDTGIDRQHPDLRGRIAGNPGDFLNDGRDGDANGCVDDTWGCSFVSLSSADPACGYRATGPHGDARDDEGHGTFVAGLIAASAANGEGGSGVAPRVQLRAVKVLDCTATGRVSDAAAGIRYAAQSGADVINISFGTTSDSRVLRAAVRAAIDLYGSIVIASGGNDGSASRTFPAAYEGVIGVGGSGYRLTDGTLDYARLAPFSNHGTDVEVLAPGVDLLAPLPAAACGRRGWVCTEESGAGRYGIASGSSFATPLVAGAVALLRADQPALSGAFLSIQLLAGAAAPGPDGIALLDVAGALDARRYDLGVPGTSRADTTTGPPRVPGN